MEILHRSYAGTLESSDLLVEVSPAQGRSIEVEITSSVEKQFEPAIRNVIMSTLEQMGVTSAHLTINDKGSLDCVIRARVQAAVMRASKGVDCHQLVWGAI
ncbi:citrate lyase acyl carrier protein [Vibrio aestuarianus]|uniref:Citrate lyase acyl carrier protein n=2 Tax=Vibrio aestuarianus TaxID=28171 RepID=A0ABM9FKZ1_9VIBR|nr:citrate lyase acyl carrier protein [Vibrio aestuarianus]MDE1228669.1 citrate lyase acyl carrier protein [Vibrio aestuarianus]MDE1255242.1 citrate lyase acyl carrier protein [Vibrio aestuarianus]MDE1272813.1 citrate lyase acyl carrier protein [Vibrio aestuarianus]MDE1294182.1 citrate lyase acyl carrier protein [Vibrio aestuarianus]MDE1308327.1 citrate lyase acyl carrier protein [Vibrio aestuarianus]